MWIKFIESEESVMHTKYFVIRTSCLSGGGIDKSVKG